MTKAQSLIPGDTLRPEGRNPAGKTRGKQRANVRRSDESLPGVARIRAEDLAASILERLAGNTIACIYRDKVRTQRTRSYQLKAPMKVVVVEVLHTLFGIELKIGKRRLICPDLGTARFLAVFARLGIDEVAVPYDITQISHLADLLESSWRKMLVLAELVAGGMAESMKRRVMRLLIARQRDEVRAAGAGPAIPEFNQNTRQRRIK